MIRWIAGLLLLVGCMGSHPGKEEGTSPSTDERGTLLDQKQGGLPKPAAFDGKRAMDYLRAICAIGPRISGTTGMEKQQQLMRKHFEGLGLKVEMQSFQAKQTTKAAITMSNMIVSYAPEKTKRVILCSHYDTRPIADQELDKAKWREPFISANDGGSGVALLMELAHHLKDLKINVGVDFVFFDGEEYIWNRDKDEYFFGSKYFAKTWVDNNRKPDYYGAILLDMIAGKEINFPFEYQSRKNAEKLCEEVWGIAKSLNIKAFKYRDGPDVLDDHIALQKAGMMAIDIIDFDYPHWHKLSDTPENCSGESMAQVAAVLSVWLQRVK